MLDEELREALKARQSAGLLRALRPVPSGVLDLASNDYLGLARHEDVVAAACDAAQEFGASARASRLVSGETAIHAELERALARWRETEKAIVFSSGWAANVAAVTSLARAGDAVFCDKRNHASLIDACRLAGSNGARVRFYNTTTKLVQLLERAATERTIIVSDAVYSMDGDIADIGALLEIAYQFDAVLILDDAHGTGTLGMTGRGAMQHWRETNRAEIDRTLSGVSLVQTGTLSKALGSQGGFVAASSAVCDWLVNAARPFVYSTGLCPAACGAALQSLKILEKEPGRVARLRDVTTKLAHGLKELGFDAQSQPSPIVPVLLGSENAALKCSEELLDRGVWCPAIRPPTVPRGTSRLRVTANAALSDEEIERALNAFAGVRSNSTVLCASH